jgi:hypothetical protein
MKGGRRALQSDIREENMAKRESRQDAGKVCILVLFL